MRDLERLEASELARISMIESEQNASKLPKVNRSTPTCLVIQGHVLLRMLTAIGEIGDCDSRQPRT